MCFPEVHRVLRMCNRWRCSRYFSKIIGRRQPVFGIYCNSGNILAETFHSNNNTHTIAWIKYLCKQDVLQNNVCDLWQITNLIPSVTLSYEVSGFTALLKLCANETNFKYYDEINTGNVVIDKLFKTKLNMHVGESAYFLKRWSQEILTSWASLNFSTRWRGCAYD